MEIADTGEREGQETKLGKHAGPLVWFTIFVMCAGFTLGGVALVYESLVWFIVGAAIFAVGGFAAIAAGVMNTTE